MPSLEVDHKALDKYYCIQATLEALLTCLSNW